MKSISLAMSYSDTMPPMPADEKEHYPSFHYTGPESLDLPHEGEMTIRFKKTSSSHSENNGEEQYSCTIEVRDIVKVKGEDVEAPTRRGNETEEALDSLAKKMKKRDEY